MQGKWASLWQGAAASRRVLANRPYDPAWEDIQRERASSAQRPHRPEAEPSMAPALGQPYPDIPGLQSYCSKKGKAAVSVSDMSGRLVRVSPVGPFQWS